MAQLEEILRPGLTPVEDGGGDGYVDLLGGEDAIGRRPGQRVFGSRLLPFVYERIWRPLVARFFFFGWGLKAAEERQITLDLLDLSPADRVVDVGCGTGNYSRCLAGSAVDGLVVGIDASAAMIAAAGKRGGGEHLAYVRGDAGKLPFRDGGFDAVCCVGVLHMLDQPMESLAEMVRVLAPGGRLVVVTSWRTQPISRVRGGVTLFGRDQVCDALTNYGCGDIHQRVVRKAQFVSAHKAVEESVGH
jgi:SAM-dependent methyltransferase